MKKDKSIYGVGIICVLLLAGLTGIQYYLIQNTYKLRVREYKAEMLTKLNAIEKDSRVIDLEESVDDSLSIIAKRFSKENLSISELDMLTESMLQNTTRRADSLFKELKKEYPVLNESQYYYVIDSLVFFDREEKPVPITTFNGYELYGKPLKYEVNVHRSRSRHVDSYTNNEITEDMYGYLLNNRVIMYSDDYQSVIWNKMRTLLLLSVGIFIAILLIFFIIFRNWLRQKKLKEVQEDFTNNVAHELKTPLTSLFISHKTLTHERVSNEERQSVLATQSRQLYKLHYIINQILDSSAEEKNIPTEEIELNHFLNEYVNTLYLEYHSLDVELNPTEIYVKTAPHKVESILNILLDNAQKYSPHHTEIGLRLYREKEWVCISVRDKGNGITPKEQALIFNKYYRVAQRNHQTKGLGLGLYMAQKYAREIGGVLEVQSKLGKGSTFILKLKPNDSYINR